MSDVERPRPEGSWNDGRATANGESEARPAAVSNAACDLDGHCVTCSDEALPARVLSIDQEMGMALVDVNGATAEVDITLVDEVWAGKLLLVHGGVAIADLEEQ